MGYGAGAFSMPRVVVRSHLDVLKVELDPHRVTKLEVVEEIGGKHELTIECEYVLAKGDRVLLKIDRTGFGGSAITPPVYHETNYHEWVVYGIKSKHLKSGGITHTYTCVWALQYDLLGTYVDTSVGYTPGQSLQNKPISWGTNAVLSDTDRYTVSNNSDTLAAATFFNMSGWDASKKLVQSWDVELDSYVRIRREYSNVNTTTETRYFRTFDQLGRFDGKPVARLEYASNVENVERTVHDGIWPCRIIPLGKSLPTEGGGYSRRPNIGSVNGGVLWVQDDDMVDYVKVPDGNGGWEYPTLMVKNDTYDDPADIKAWAIAHIREYTTPKVTYKADALAFGRMGLTTSELQLGDTVIICDADIVEGGLAVESRIVGMKYDMLGDHQKATITIGSISTSLPTEMMGMSRQIGTIQEQMDLTSME